MKKIFIPTPLDEIIELPKDVTHHVLHVFRHNMEMCIRDSIPSMTEYAVVIIVM